MLRTPLVCYGIREDFANGGSGGWNYGGGGVIFGGNTASLDPFQSGSSFVLSDSSIAVSSSIQRAVTAVRYGRQYYQVWMRNVSAQATVIEFQTSVNTPVGTVRYTWNNGVPTPSVQAGDAKIFNSVSGGNGWYLCRCASPVTSGSLSMQMAIYPDAASNAATGSVLLWGRNTVIFGYPWYNPTQDDEYRDGSVFAQAPSGVEDAWIVGTYQDEKLKATIRFIPDYTTDFPYPATGYFGANEAPGFNVSVKAMVLSGRAKNLLTIVPDASLMTNNVINAYLVDPQKDGISLEQDFTKTFSIVLRSPNGVPFEGF